MRYLIFNVTVLAALGYLFMASPDQSFANWIGKAPQMFDAARMAGRGPVADGNPEATAGSALLEAVEPVVDQVLSTSDGMYSEPVPTDGLSEATPPRDIHAIATQKAPTPDGNAQPVTMQDIESIIRSLLDAKAAETGDVAAGGIPAPAGEEVELVEPAPNHRPSGGSPSHAASAEAAPDQTLQAQSGAGADDASRSQAALQDMNDEEIAAAFEPFRQPSGSGPVTPQPGQAAETADLETGLPGVVPGEAGTGTSPAADTPAFMTPGQRADSLALMVEELQLMYLERTGG
ncbi:MAG: hypothetical protein VX200_03595 [Pseudomonadota bacterium]|nr:hypothetical protein [Pseudomonadota bacterium]